MDLRAGGICLEVRATGESVTLRTLEPSSYAFSDALARGLTLGEATGLTLESHPSFDLAVAIQDLLERSLFADFTITPAEGG